MIYLLAASLLWAFSFGLIKGQLTGLDPVLVSFLRLIISVLAFAPFLLKARNSWSRAWPMVGLGAVQFGLMYVLYIASFAFLPAWMVALFTVTTPLYVVLLAGLLDRQVPARFWMAVLLAIGGGAVVLAQGLPAGASWKGILLLQGANLCFAVGQVLYPRLKDELDAPDAPALARMYLGALVVPLVVLAIQGGQELTLPSGRQWLVLVYLGLLPTALGFYLWNKGAALVGAGFLASVNNLKAPLAVLVSWLVFGEEANYLRVLTGLILVVSALFVAGFQKNKIN